MKLFRCFRKKRKAKVIPKDHPPFLKLIEQQRSPLVPILRQNSKIQYFALDRVLDQWEAGKLDNHEGFFSIKKELLRAFQSVDEIQTRQKPGSPPEVYVNAFMSSPDHRAKLTLHKWTHIGYGIREGYCVVIFGEL